MTDAKSLQKDQYMNRDGVRRYTLYAAHSDYVQDLVCDWVVLLGPAIQVNSLPVYMQRFVNCRPQLVRCKSEDILSWRLLNIRKLLGPVLALSAQVHRAPTIYLILDTRCRFCTESSQHLLHTIRYNKDSPLKTIIDNYVSAHVLLQSLYYCEWRGT